MFVCGISKADNLRRMEVKRAVLFPGDFSDLNKATDLAEAFMVITCPV
jgi:hypothetical protein